MTKLGVIFKADRPPEELAAFATAAESAGLDELWLWEDCFLAGGIATSATALAATTRITVGLGVMPAVFRNPVAAAMEIATLARLHPGRFVAGLGHGVPAWMDQIGALPPKPVRALEETTVAVRRLLAGESFSTKGDYVNLREVCLAQPPMSRPPVVLWRAAQRNRRSEGRASAGRTDPHRVTVFVNGRVDADRGRARDVVADMLLSESVAAQLAPLHREAELAELRALGDPAAIAPLIPDDLLDDLTATGTSKQVIASLSAIAETGVDTIVVAPIGPDPDEQLRLLAGTIAPAFQG